MSVRMKEQRGQPPGSTKGISVSCKSVVAGYLGSTVLRDISFTIEEPAVYVVLGPNGAGKTTLFRTLSGILRPYQGEVYIGGEPVDRQASRNHLHYLSHMDGVPDDLRVREALEYYARVERGSSADIERVLDIRDSRTEREILVSDQCWSEEAGLHRPRLPPRTGNLSFG